MLHYCFCHSHSGLLDLKHVGSYLSLRPGIKTTPTLESEVPTTEPPRKSHKSVFKMSCHLTRLSVQTENVAWGESEVRIDGMHPYQFTPIRKCHPPGRELITHSKNPQSICRPLRTWRSLGNWDKSDSTRTVMKILKSLLPASRGWAWGFLDQWGGSSSLRESVCGGGEIPTPATKAAPVLGLYTLGIMQEARGAMKISGWQEAVSHKPALCPVFPREGEYLFTVSI